MSLEAKTVPETKPSNLAIVVELYVGRLYQAHEALLAGDGDWASKLYHDVLELMEADGFQIAEVKPDEIHPTIVALIKEAALGAGYADITKLPTYLLQIKPAEKVGPVFNILERVPFSEQVYREIGENFALTGRYREFRKYMRHFRQIPREFLQNLQKPKSQ